MFRVIGPSSRTPIEPLRLPWLLRTVQSIEFPHKLGLCDRVFGRRLAPRGICWVPTAAAVTWKLDLANSTHRWIVYGKYEGSAFLNWAKGSLPCDGIVVDSGANIGQMSLYLAQWVPEGKVLAFEPHEAQADWLQECLDVNESLPVEVIRLGLGSRQADLSLAEAGFPARHGAQNYVCENGNVPIRVVRLADEIAKRGIDHIDLWKLDVEGYELEALKGAESLLKKQAIRALYVEIQESLQSEIITFLRKYNYRGHAIGRRGELTRVDRFADFSMGLFLQN